MSRKQAHLAHLGAVIWRLSLGSWLLRMWALLLFITFVAVSLRVTDTHFASLALAAAIAAWLLDAYFSRQRKLFVKLRQRVNGLEEAQVDYSTETRAVDTEAEAWSSVMLSRPLVLLHGAIVLAIAVVRITLHVA